MRRMILKSLLLSITLFIFWNVRHVSAQQTPKLVVSQLQTESPASKSDEFVEIGNVSDLPVDVTNWCVRYSSANSSSYAKSFCIFPDGSILGQRVLLPAGGKIMFVSSVHSSLQGDVHFAVGMSSGGGRVLITDGGNFVVDSLAWGSSGETAEGLAPAPALDSEEAEGKVLSRKLLNGVLIDTDNNTNDFELIDPRPDYPIGSLYEVIDYCTNLDGIQDAVPNNYERDDKGECHELQEEVGCEGIIINEVLPNPSGVDRGKEYVELFNPTEEAIDLSGCSLKSSSSQREFSMTGISIESGEFRALYDSETGITLPNSGGGSVWLLTKDLELDSIKYPAGLADDQSYARFDGGWNPTYTPTPGLENILLVQLPCPAGQIRSELTGRCGGSASATTLSDCGPGRYRSPETNRCRNIVTQASGLVPCRADQVRNSETNRCRSISSSSSSLQPCAADQYRNPETNRCKKIESAGSSLVPCNPGQERNPETNRCRKVAEILGDSAATPAKAEDDLQKSLASDYRVWSLLGLGLVGYGFYEYRSEIGRFARRYFTRSGRPPD